MAGWTQARLDGDPPDWLLVFTWAGRTWRVATRTLNISDAAGAALAFQGSLNRPDLDAEADLFATSPELASVPLDLHFEDADPAALHAAGHVLEGARAELSLHSAGDAYEDRTRILTGYLSGVTYGPAGEPVTCSLEADPLVDDVPILARAARVSSTTWSNPARSARGLSYPLVWGQPGMWTDTDGTARETSGSPALLVSTTANTLLISDGPTEAGQDGATVEVFNDSNGTSGNATASHALDGAGRLVTVCDLTSTGVTVNTEHTYYVKWDTAGGALGRDGEPVADLGELVWHLLTRSRVAWDRSRIAAVLPWLRQVPSSGYIDDPEAGALDWIAANVLSLVPAGMASGPDGVYVVPWILGAPINAATAHLREGEGIYRIPGQPGHVQTGERSEVVNLPRIRYALRARTGVYQGEAALVADDSDGGTLSAAVRASVASYGPREREQSTDIIYDGAAALRALQWQVRAYAQPLRRITYHAAPSLAYLDPGSYVLITDAGLHLSAQPATVTRRGWGGGLMQVELLLHPVEVA